MSAGMRMTRARALALLNRERAFRRSILEVDFAEAIDLAVADMEKVRRRQRLMKRDLIRRAKARKEAAK